MKAIKSCRNSKAFGLDKLSIFHMKYLGPTAIEYITTLVNLSVTPCQIPTIWKSSLIILIPKPDKDTSHGTSECRPSFQPQKFWNLCSYLLSANISSQLQTSTVSDLSTLPPQLCYSYQHTFQWDSTRGRTPPPIPNLTGCVRCNLP